MAQTHVCYILYLLCLHLTCGANPKNIIDWRSYLTSLLKSTLKTTNAREMNTDLIASIKAVMITLNLTSSICTEYQPHPDPSVIKVSPCGAILTATYNDETVDGEENIKLRVQLPSNVKLSLNVTVLDLDLVREPQGCSAEGIRINPSHGGNIKPIENSNQLPDLCGNITHKSFHLTTTNFTVVYWIIGHLANIRLLKTYEGSVKITWQISLKESPYGDFFHVLNGLNLATLMAKDLCETARSGNSGPRDPRDTERISIYDKCQKQIKKYKYLLFFTGVTLYPRAITIIMSSPGLILHSLVILPKNTISKTQVMGNFKFHDGGGPGSPELFISAFDQTSKDIKKLSENGQHETIVFSPTKGHLLTAVSRVKYNETENNFKIYFVASLKAISPDMTIRVENNETRHYSHVAVQSYDMMMFTTQEGMFLNVTVVSLNSVGFNTRGCLYHGLMVYTYLQYEIIEKLYKGHTINCQTKTTVLNREIPCDPIDVTFPILHICDSVLVPGEHETRRIVLPNQYISNHNRVVVIWYAYGDSSIDGDVSVTTTPCIGTATTCSHLNFMRGLYMYAQTPVSHEDMNESVNFTRASSFRMRHRVMSLYSDEFFGGDLYLQNQFEVRHYNGKFKSTIHQDLIESIFYPNWGANCFILQILQLHQQSEDGYRDCRIGFKPFIPQDNTFDISTTIKGIPYRTCSGVRSSSSTEHRKREHVVNLTHGCNSLSMRVARIQMMNYETYSGPKHHLLYMYDDDTICKQSLKNNTLYPWLLKDQYDGRLINFVADNLLFSENFSLICQKNIISISHVVNTGTGTLIRKPLKLHLLQLYLRVKITIESNNEIGHQIGVAIYGRTHRGFETYRWINTTIHKELVITEQRLFVVRSIVLIFDRKECETQNTSMATMTIHLDPFVPITDTTESKHRISQEPPSLDQVGTIYYVLYRPDRGISTHQALSWNNASKMCTSSGGHLPVIKSESDLNLLESLLLGARFNSGRTPFYTALRDYTSVNAFIGLKSPFSHWVNEEPVTVSLFSTNKKSSLIRDVICPRLYRKSSRYKGGCVMARYDVQTHLEWVVVPCELQMVLSTVICQTRYNHNSSPENNMMLLVYINKKAEVTLSSFEKCDENSDIDEFLCLNDILSIKSGLSKTTFSYLEKSLKGFLSAECPKYRVSAHRFTLCINKLLMKHNVHLIGMSVLKNNNLLISSPYTCPKNSTGYNGCCYMAQASECAHKSEFGTEPVYTACNTSDIITSLSNVPSTKQLLCVVSGTLRNTSSLKLPHQCEKGQRICQSGECVSDWVIMDGDEDCLDAADEGRVVCEGGDGNKTPCSVCIPPQCACAEHYFQCESGGCIPWHQFCDGVIHCRKEEDEKRCPFQGKSIRIPGTPITRTQKTHVCPASNTVIPLSSLGDGKPDCPIFRKIDFSTDFWKYGIMYEYAAEDENQEQTLNFRCNESETFGCKYDKRGTCFHLAKFCVYELDSITRRLQHCENGGHLVSCERHECSGLFKCPMSYCLPLRRVCDGFKDCPWGEDERECPVAALSCPGMLRCKGGGCVHPVHVCDGHVDCQLLGEDELMCDRAECPAGCECFSLSVICNTMVNTDFFVEGFYDLKIISTAGQSFQAIIYNSSNLFQFKLTGAILPVVSNINFKDMINLRYLDLSENQIQSIRPDSFKTLCSLERLNLSHNSFGYISAKVFNLVPSIEILDLTDALNSNNLSIGIAGLSVLDMSQTIVAFLHLNLSNMPEFSQITLLGAEITELQISGTFTKGVKIIATTNAICCLLDNSNHSFTCETTTAIHPSLCIFDQPGFAWVLGLTLVTTSLGMLVKQLIRKKTPASGAAISQTVAGLLIALHLVIVDLKSVNQSPTLLPVPGGIKDILCHIAAVLQYIATGVQIFGVAIILQSLLIITKYWSKPKAEVIKIVKRGVLIAWVHHIGLVMLVLLFSDGEILLDHSCSFLVGSRLKGVGLILPVYPLIVIIGGLILIIVQIWKINEYVISSKKEVQSFTSGTTSKDTKVESTFSKLCKKHLIPMCLNIPMVITIMVDFYDNAIPQNVTFVLTVFIFSMPTTFILMQGILEIFLADQK